MRYLLTSLLCLLLSATAEAQIYALEFRDAKSSKSFQKHFYPWNGRNIVLAELKTELPRDSRGQPTWQDGDRIEVFVQNQSDPLDLPYAIKDGQKTGRKKSLVLSVKGTQLGGLIPFMGDESFASLAKEYQKRLDVLETLEEQRSKHKAKTPEWQTEHKHYLQELGSLALWLNYTGYFDAVSKLQRKLSIEKRRGGNQENQRLINALDSAHYVPIDPELQEAADVIGGKGLVFRSLETTHMKFVYHSGIPDEQIAALANLGESVIDDFRTELVDPYLSDGFADEIPDDIFVEFFFAGSDIKQYERLYEVYLGGDWGEGEEREQKLNLNGKWIYFNSNLVSYWRTDLYADLEGQVVHGLGHRLAALHYQIHQGSQDWLEEAVGYYLSLKFLNKNSITCFDFHRDIENTGDSVAQANPREAGHKNGDSLLFVGKRNTMAQDAMTCRLPFAQLVPLRKYDFTHEEFSKAWAVFAFLAEAKGKEGQVWLRSLTEIVDAGSFHDLIQEHAQEMLGYEGSNPLQAMEQDWASFMRKNYDV